MPASGDYSFSTDPALSAASAKVWLASPSVGKEKRRAWVSGPNREAEPATRESKSALERKVAWRLWSSTRLTLNLKLRVRQGRRV